MFTARSRASQWETNSYPLQRLQTFYEKQQRVSAMSTCTMDILILKYNYLYGFHRRPIHIII